MKQSPGQTLSVPFESAGSTSGAPRSTALDALRFVAITLVLLQHFTPDSWRLAHRIGWTGVDLFFSLSGFLVTRLLLNEFSRTQAVDAGRFLIRRGFKIYPSFWIMEAVTIVILVLTSTPIRPRALFCELFFLQNYGPGLWGHTWSLAVEEHFYFLLAGLFVWWARKNPARLPSLRAVVVFMVGLTAVVLALRVLGLFFIPEGYRAAKFATHVRIDALFAGAVVAYLQHTRAVALEQWVSTWKNLLRANLLFLTPLFFFGEEGAFFRVISFSLCEVAYVSLLLLAIHATKETSTRLQWPAAIGQYSYGIYLWHPLVEQYLVRPLLEDKVSPAVLFAILSVAAIAVGVVLSKAIEFPFLKLRDRLVPNGAAGQ